eukprot:1158370-Pelagomonas_calceolata.AAC.3
MVKIQKVNLPYLLGASGCRVLLWPQWAEKANPASAVTWLRRAEQQRMRPCSFRGQHEMPW